MTCFRMLVKKVNYSALKTLFPFMFFLRKTYVTTSHAPQTGTKKNEADLTKEADFADRI